VNLASTLFPAITTLTLGFNLPSSDFGATSPLAACVAKLLSAVKAGSTHIELVIVLHGRSFEPVPWAEAGEKHGIRLASCNWAEYRATLSDDSCNWHGLDLRVLRAGNVVRKTLDAEIADLSIWWSEMFGAGSNT